MALAFGSSTIYTYTTRFPIRISPAPAAHAPTVVAVKQHVSLPSPIRAPTVQFNIPYTTIDLFFRTQVQTVLRARHDTPSADLVLDDVLALAVPSLRAYVENINDHVKIEYTATSKQLIISCASAEHNFMAGIGREIMALISSSNNAFTGDDPAYEIIENSDSGVPLGDEKHGRQPDGGLRLLNSALPPFLIWEVLDSQPLPQMIEKISHYFTRSRGRIRIVIVIQLIRQRKHSPLGRLLQGFYWVYKHALTPSGQRRIQCVDEHVEFYPAMPEGVLTLTWADIVRRPPQQLAQLTLEIPFKILHERFAKLVRSAEVPGVLDESEGEELWDLDGFPGIEESKEEHVEEEEGEEGEEGEEDGSFDGGKQGVQGGGVVRRSKRLAKGAV